MVNLVLCAGRDFFTVMVRTDRGRTFNETETRYFGGKRTALFCLVNVCIDML